MLLLWLSPSPNHLSLCVWGGEGVHVCVCVCCIYVFVYGMYMHQVPIIISSYMRRISSLLSPIFLFSGSVPLTVPELPGSSRLSGQWTREFFCLYAHSTGATGKPSHPAFTRVLEIWTRVLMLVRQVLYWLSYIPALTITSEINSEATVVSTTSNANAVASVLLLINYHYHYCWLDHHKTMY